MTGDDTVILAALVGAAAGLLLLRIANARDARAARTDRDRPPPPPGPPTPTSYAGRPVHSAAPILFAVGVALVGVGLVFGTGDGGWNLLPLIPGLLVLLAALGATLRRDGGAGSA